MADQRSATIASNEAVTRSAGGRLLPALIADLGDQASWRYVAFFTAHIRNPNTRRAYARACSQFLHHANRPA